MEFVPAVGSGLVMGTLARWYMLRTDYRQFPSYPQGYAIHLSLGFIAAFLGAIAIPAIVSGDLAAASFLALAATQFREVRATERQTLANMEATELVRRGTAYIEGIARVFEARNYFAMVTALLTSLAGVLLRGQDLAVVLAVAAATGGAVTLALSRFMVGKRVADVADVLPARIEFEGPLLTIAGVQLVNLGLAQARERYRRDGLAVMIRPRDADAAATLANEGQRQAIVHDAATLLGVQLDVDQPEFTPLARRNPQTGEVVVGILPVHKDIDALIRAVSLVPILEGAIRKPLDAGVLPSGARKAR